MKLPILFFCVTYVLLTLCTSSEAEELHPAEVSALRDLMAFALLSSFHRIFYIPRDIPKLTPILYLLDILRSIWTV
jgi:hypothetical protein